MQNVFIAVGGSGTKVAEALVGLLAVGLPTRQDENGILTSDGDSLQIWRVDPDRSSGAADTLKEALASYQELGRHLTEHASDGSLRSRWAMDIEATIRDLDPLDLKQATETDNTTKTLAGILDSRYGDKESSLPLLAPFYEEKELQVKIDRGFYQKPFIGSAVMSIFANSLSDPTSPGGGKAGLTALENNPVNFFLCGSLHGGTGACGVPVIGEFLSTRRDPTWKWRVGACLLGPYFRPPRPPFYALKPNNEENRRLINLLSKNDGNYNTLPEDIKATIDALIERHSEHPAFASMQTLEEKQELVKQILLGFYAEPEELDDRARQGLSYYRDHGAAQFDELYLVGKPTPSELESWSNGGNSQRNPLNSAEVVAALSALNFFSMASTGNPNSYVIGSSSVDLDKASLRLQHVPVYRLGPSKQEIDVERAVLATGLMHHLVLHQIRWDLKAHEWSDDIKQLRAVYEDNETGKEDDHTRYQRAMVLIAGFLRGLINAESTIGWSGEDMRELWYLLESDDESVRDVTSRMEKKGWLSKEPKGENVLGMSAIKITTFDFSSWCPPGDRFSQGEYLRFIWDKLYRRANPRIQQ